jgi:nitroimidazol reductase NimA-like FMN-containing flavoprotein (pyridoxamine 5'-phosphate oxidase superfamily)
MAVIQGRTWLQILALPDCWRLVGTMPVGRIALQGDRGPDIFPVNFALDGETIVFRTERGTKLSRLTDGADVAFEVDGIDVDSQSGWSVVLKGHAHQIRDPDELAALAKLPLRYWAPGLKPHWIRVVPRDVTGRQIRPARPS